MKGEPSMPTFSRRHFVGSLAIIPCLRADTPAVPIASTSSGRVRGLIQDSVKVFKAIPYGADTVTTRFQAPKPPAPWKDVLDCAAFATMAPQINAPRGPAAGNQSEDCLRLNVFSPALRDGKRRPVLVYFHGGAYNNGSCNSDLYDGRRLVHRGDVVVVTVNHRLNAFGYLYLGDLAPEYAQSGNAGQLDLILALKWVRDNIAEFGGDPGRVLIFGQSGGGAKCASLMATPAAKGLFHRVLTMSGQQIKGASIEIGSGRARNVLEKLGIDPKSKALVAQLNACTMQQIQEAGRAVSPDWLPVVDNVVLPRNPFDPDAPALSEAVPMILGNTHDETAVPSRNGPMTWDNAAAALHDAVAQYLGPYKAEEVVAKYREIYPNYTPEQVDIAAATAFRAWPGQRYEAERRAANANSQPRTWVYQMNFQGATGKAVHTIDIPFMFDNIAFAQQQVGALEPANSLAAKMSEMLIAYAKTGNPNCDAIPHWPPYDLKNRPTMIWERTPRIENDPRRAEREFADKSKYHQAGTPM
jgi:para-nitrobenzyl esterase